MGDLDQPVFLSRPGMAGLDLLLEVRHCVRGDGAAASLGDEHALVPAQHLLMRVDSDLVGIEGRFVALELQLGCRAPHEGQNRLGVLLTPEIEIDTPREVFAVLAVVFDAETVRGGLLLE